jgi:hypothetical protein
MPIANSFSLVNLQSMLQTTTDPTVLDNSGNRITASTAITTFLYNPNSEDYWDIMSTLIQAFITANASSIPGLRVLITLSDGKVAYDTGKTNTFQRYQNGTINENHNTRVAILTALLGNSGNGNEEKFSTSTGIPEAYNAIRMGLSTTNSLGCSRVSLNNSL